MRRLAPALTLIAVMLAIMATGLKVLRETRIVPDPEREKLRAADKIIYYSLTHDRGVKIRLSGSERRLKLISHLLLSEGNRYDPARSYGYGLRLEIRAGGKFEAWERAVHVESRQSKRDLRGTYWRHENSFTLHGEVQVTDDRSSIITLPTNIPPNATLSLSMTGKDSHGIVRVYAQSVRPSSARQAVARAMTSRARRKVLASTTYARWNLTPRRERLSRLRFRSERLAAIGERGTDYETQTIYVTEFRLPPVQLAPKIETPVHKYRSVALNLVGPAEVTVVATHATGEGNLTATLVAASGKDTTLSLGGATNGRLTTRVTVPSGLHTLALTSESETPWLATVEGLPKQVYGKEASLQTDAKRLDPTEVRFPVFATGPGTIGVDVSLLESAAEVERLVRVDVRLHSTTPSRIDTGMVRVDYIDKTGAILSSASQTVVTQLARFEFAQDSQGKQTYVSEPVTLRIVVPRKAVTLRINSPQPAAVRLFRYQPGEAQLMLPYRDETLVERRWRYATLDRRRWYPVLPANHRALADATLDLTLVAQVRLEHLVQRHGVARGTVSATVIRPVGRPLQRTILEPRPDTSAAAWRRGMVTDIPLSKDVSLTWPAGVSPRATVEYAIAEADLGQTITWWVDNVKVLSEELLTTRGTLRMPRIKNGTHQVRVASGAASLRALIDRPSNEGLAVFQRRTVYALRADTPMRVRVTRPRNRAVSLNAVIYARWPGPSTRTHISAWVDGGRPPRNEGHLVRHITPGTRHVSLPASNRPWAAAFVQPLGKIAGYPRVVPVRIGEDIRPGTYNVDLSMDGAKLLWVRFFATNQSGAARDRILQSRFRDTKRGRGPKGRIQK